MLKKLFAIVCMAIAVWACNNSEDDVLVVPETNDVQAGELLTGIRTEAEARACAMEAYATFYGASRSLTLIKDVKCVTSKGGSRSAVGDTLYYVVNTEDNAGYALIAADRNLPPVLAVTESGNIENVDSVETPGASIFLGALETAGRFEIRDDLKDSTKIIKPIYPIDPLKDYTSKTIITDTKTGPKTPCQWGQTFPEGHYFPNQQAGCGNVASVLAMSCFEEPKTFPGYDNKTIDIDWELLKQHITSGPLYDHCGYSVAAPQHKLLAYLCRSVAIKNNSTYGQNTTGTVMQDINRMFKQYVPNLTVSDVIYEFPDINSAVSKDVYIVGATCADGSHAFIIDGKLIHKVVHNRYERSKLSTSDDDWKLISSTTQYEYYSHINWGWNGVDNGYFASYPFRTDAAREYDGLSGHTDYYSSNYHYFKIGERLQLSK